MPKHSPLETCLAKVEALLEKASSFQPKEANEAVLARARNVIERCLALDPNDITANHIAGLVMYESFSLLDEGYGPKAEQHFLRVTELGPDHPNQQFAQMYLGYYYYDVGSYQAALEHFGKISEDYFLSIGQRWRILKMHELILCCKTYLDDDDLRLSDFSELVDEYLSVDEEDAPLPLEVATTFSKARESHLWVRISGEDVRAQLTRLITELGFFDTLGDLLIDG